MATLIFEDPNYEALYREWQLEPEVPCLDFIGWINRLLPPKNSPEERLALFSAFPGLENEDAALHLQTIEELRRSLILQREHVTHCFLELPSSQKNRKLRELFLRYVDSPLTEDFTSRVWNLIHALKTKTFKLEAGPWIFVPAASPSYLFKEIVTAVLSNGAEAEVRPFHELGEGLPAATPIAHRANRAVSLQQLKVEILKLEEPRLWIPLAATPGAASWLRYSLLNAGVRSEFWKAEVPEQDFFAKLLTQIRQAPERGTLERLKIIATLRKRPIRPTETETTYFERLAKGSLSAEIVQWLGSLSAKATPTAPPVPEARITFIPFLAPPLSEKTPALGYFDDSVLQAPREVSLLTESEREILLRAGFQVSSFSQREKALENQARVLAQRRHVDGPTLFTPVSSQLLAEWKIGERPLFEEPPPASDAPSYLAPLGDQALSATALETFAECPAKYWISRLKLNREEDIMDRYALIYGQAVHSTLEHILQSSDELSLENLHIYFAKALGELDPLLTQKGSLGLLFTEAFRKLAPRIIEGEKTLATLFPGSQKIGFEKSFEINTQGMKLIGKIDRIDKIPGQGALVLDYKTGSIDFTPDHIAQGKNFQAFLYWLAAESLEGEEPVGVLFYDLKKGEIRRGLVREEAVSAETKKALTRGHVLIEEKRLPILEKGWENLRAAGAKIREGIFVPTPSQDACRFCEGAVFCRKGWNYA